MKISSIHNERIKAAVKLRDRKGRDLQARFLIDGAREVERAALSGLKIDELYIDEATADSSAGQSLLDRLGSHVGEVLECTLAVFDKISYGDRVGGVVGVAAVPDHSLATFEQKISSSLSTSVQLPLLTVLEGVEKPGNIGAVLRSADAAGMTGLIIADGGTDLFNPNVIRASAGAIFAVPTAVASVDETLQWLRERHFQIVAAKVDATRFPTAIDFTRPTAIVLGSEANGLTSAWNGDDIQAVKIPMRGIVDSLNVSITAAVLFYEALRQRGFENA